MRGEEKRFSCLWTLLPIVLGFVWLAAGSLGKARAVEPERVDFLAEFEARPYGTDDGLASAEINTVAQTPDGYLWVGTYSGLYRYDGSRFEKMQLDERISSVMKLFVSSRGYLWIGTNDNGICRYDPESGETAFYTTEEGLAANAIRSIAENDRGDLYIGTVSYLSVISADGTRVDTHDEWPALTGVRSLVHGGDGVLAGVSNGGTLFFVKDRSLIVTDNLDADGIYYAAVGTDGRGGYAVGTSSSQIVRLTYDGERLRHVREIATQDIAYYNTILYDPTTDGYFFCAENGLGHLSPTDQLTRLNQERFESSISEAIIDYQKNIWFVSNKQGMMEFSRNPFVDLFVRAGMPSDVVNALLVSGNDLFIGMDTGLRALDLRTLRRKNLTYLEPLDGVRIRHLARDSGGNIWVSTYSKLGLVKITPDRQLISFDESKGTIGGRFRYAMELSDGTIAAASNMGLSFIQGDRVVRTLGEADGLEAPMILSMVEDADGTLYAGTDGAGIYLIRDGEIVSHIGAAEGLGTLVVLRIVPCRSGFFYVTSNALYYDDRQTIRKLNAFPYSNNYDIFLTDSGEAWVLSSAGIFIVREQDLIENGTYRYTLLDYSRGFDTSLTANAWSEVMEDDGSLLLCCTDGVRMISIDGYNSFDENYYIRLNRLTYDDTEIYPDGDGTYVIPANARRIQIQASVLNYTLSNPLVRVFLENASDEGLTVYQNELTPLYYTNLPYGDYVLHVQTVDSTDYSVIREETFAIRKNARIVEYLAFRVTAVALAIFLAGVLVWWFLRSTVIQRQYVLIKEARDEAERANSAKSRFLANMSHEIRTPINTIMGMDELILREETSPAVAGYARDIQQASESLLGLVNDILDLSKIESGKMNLVEQEYDTADFIRGLTTMIRVRSAAKELDFYTEIDPALPRRLIGDDGKIRQVVLNLLTNAVKYTEEGSFTLKIQVRERTEETVTVEYSVSDTGIGIRPEDMDKLFSAFERLEEKRNSGIQGTGLGLDISRQFVALMGDELQVESVYGQGSTFHFAVRQRISDAAPIGAFREEEREEKKDRYSALFEAPEARILAVDDNRMNLQVLKGLLKPTKVQIVTAMSGAEALALLAGDESGAAPERFHLVLLDHMMPEMDGVETLHEIRRRGIDIPVLALTANAVSGIEDYYLGEGFQGYISKPIVGRKLEEAIARYLPGELMKEGSDAPVEQAPSGEEAVDGAPGPSPEAAPPQGEGGSQPRIDRGAGVEFCAGDEGFFREMLREYLSQEEDKRRQLAEALERGDLGDYAVQIHALKGNSKMIGAMAFAETCFSLEKAAKAGDLDEVRAHHGEMLEEYRAVLSEAEGIIN